MLNCANSNGWRWQQLLLTRNSIDSSPHSGCSNIVWTAITGPSNVIGFRLTCVIWRRITKINWWIDCLYSVIFMFIYFIKITESFILTFKDFIDLLLDKAFKTSPSPFAPILLAERFRSTMTSLTAVADAISSEPWSSNPFHDTSNTLRHVFSWGNIAENEMNMHAVSLNKLVLRFNSVGMSHKLLQEWQTYM